MKGVARLSYRVTETLHSEQSPYQRIDVYQTAHHGRLLVLDGCVMLTELEEFVYHEMLAHVPAQAVPVARTAVVVGGGVSALAPGRFATEEHLKEVSAIFDAVGLQHAFILPGH